MQLNYFLSEDEVEEGAAGAAAGVALLLSVEVEAAAAGAALESLELSLFEPPLAADGFFEPYPSANQPPPLNCIAGAEITRSSLPPQCGHTVISASENFWIFSVRLWHCVHSYS